MKLENNEGFENLTSFDQSFYAWTVHLSNDLDKFHCIWIRRNEFRIDSIGRLVQKHKRSF